MSTLSDSTPLSADARHFVLVHGSCHGGWCWFKLVSLLEDAGHKVTALDLAASGRNQVPFKNLKTVDDYHKPLFSYLDALPDDDRVILVGHSWGGYGVSSAMERFPQKIALAVFVSSFMVGPDLTIDQINKKYWPSANSFEDSTYTIDETSGFPTSILFGPKFMLHKLYQKSPYEDLALATLSARVAKYFIDEKSKLELLVTKENYGTVPRAYFIGGEDQAIPVDMQLWMIENTPPDEVRKIAGADHMVMISKVQELCYNLLEVSQIFY